MNIHEAIYASIREPRRRQMSHWDRALEEHRRHTEFRTEGWAFSREVGFSCGCSGCDQEWRISLTTLRSRVPEIQNRYMRLRDHDLLAGSKKRKREERKANMKAKALLHSQLTREQRWQLRAEKAFTVVGRDGRMYLITEGSTSNVRLIENGEATHSFCVVAKDLRLPTYDLMLAQKLMLETAPEDFHKLAVVRNLREEPPTEDDWVADITDEDLENPANWVRQRIAI